jgi:phage tail-like protein
MQNPEPLTTFRFLVEVESAGNRIVAAFAQFSGVKAETETVKVRTGSEFRGIMDSVPALTTYKNVTLTKGVIGDNEFLEWLLSATPGAVRAATGNLKYRTINIVALNDKGDRAITWSLYSALPVAYELDAMDGTQSAVLTETIEFAYRGFKRETHPGRRPPL